MTPRRFKLKWTDDDPGNSFMLSFHSKWQTPICNGEVSVVFRKTWPTKIDARAIYAYFGAPTSAIAAKFPIEGLELLPIQDALAFSAAGAISRAELETYATDFDAIYVCHIGSVEVANSPVDRKFLTDEYDFWPSSTYMPLSSYGEETLDRLAEFSARHKS